MWLKPSAMAGSTMLLNPLLPDTGNHPSLSENNRINNKPNQKIGMDTPIRAMIIDTPSKIVFCLTAAITPNGIATTIAISMAATVSWIVFGNRLNTSSDTGPFVLYESPISPCTSFTI